MYHNSYEKIDITDFEKLCLLADDVFDQIRHSSYRYENNGDSISALYFQIENEDEAREEVRRRVDAEIEKETAAQTIDLIDMILNENYTLRDAITQLRQNLKKEFVPYPGKLSEFLRNLSGGIPHTMLTNQLTKNYCLKFLQ